eukprot:6409250-Amphidinium_carterae.2
MDSVISTFMLSVSSISVKEDASLTAVLTQVTAIALVACVDPTISQSNDMAYVNPVEKNAPTQHQHQHQLLRRWRVRLNTVR